MVGIERSAKPILGRSVAVLALSALTGACGSDAEAPQPPLRVGVMLPMTGADNIDWREPLDLAQGNIQHAGGPAGRDFELVYQDTATLGLAAASTALLSDPSILAVIGPDTSSGLMNIAPSFVAAHKTLLSPSATSGDIFRAFGGSSYIWRTVQSDVAQVKTMLLLATGAGAKKVALVTSNDAYGTTFFDWIGFFATELDIEVTALVRYDSTNECDTFVAQALAGKPDTLLVAPSSAGDSICIVRSARKLSPATNLLFSDAGESSAFIKELGPLAEGIEGTAPAADPTSGFDVAFNVLYGHSPPAYGANVYDALTLVAFGLERSRGQGGTALATAMAEVVDGRGAPTRWDRQGVEETLAALRRGELPNLVGASGPLDFDQELHTDPIATTYVHWRVDHGQFVPVESISTGESGRTQSLDDSFASQSKMQDLGTGGGFTPGPRTGQWALVVGMSMGWQNYRHQADALAQYQLLRANGVSDDHIVFVLADDLADDPLNAEPGVVRNVAGGPNLHNNLQIDYRIGDLQAGDLLAILSGERSDRLPTVVESGVGDDVYVFLVGHGTSEGMLVGGANAVAGGETVLTPEGIGSVAQAMWDQARYRRLLVAVETCHGGVMGTQLSAPGALLIAGANPIESSFGTNYVPALSAWVADQFAYQLVTMAKATPQIAIGTLYQQLFLRVRGSHVSIYNNQAFGGAGGASLLDFLQP